MSRRRNLIPLFHLLNGIALFTVAMIGFDVWDKLPKAVPVHFGIDGLPDRWSGKGAEAALLFALPWIVTGILYLGLALYPWMRRHPRWMNIPHKERFLALPAEMQRGFFDLLVEFHLAVTLACNALFLLIILATVRVAFGKTDRLPAWGIWPGLALVLAVSAL